MATNDNNVNYCTQEEAVSRVMTCYACPSLIIVNEITNCADTGCAINMMSTFKDKSCPRGNW